MRRTFNVAVSLTKNDYAEFELRPPINMVSGDHGTNILKFTVYDKGLPVDLSGNIAKITCKTPSGSRQQQDMTISSPQEGKMEVVLDQRFFTEGGTYLAEVQLYDPANLKVRATLPRFTYDVDTSLLEEHRVVANEQFSILQQMVDTVASAEERSVEALDTATRAMNIATQKGDKATEEANRAKNEADRAKNEADRAWAADFAKHVTLNAETQQNFNFIENKVVQDGLIDSKLNLNMTTNKQLNGVNILNDDFTLIGIVTKNENVNIVYVPYITSFRIEWASVSKLWMTKVGTKVILQNTELNQYVPFVYMKSNDIITIQIGDKIASASINEMPREDIEKWGLGNSANLWIGTSGKSMDLGYAFYNRVLTPQEIQHTLSAINNTPSIKELHTTDTTGKTSILKFASDTDHVEDRAGRTQEQINRNFYKRGCKEFTSADGSPITVNNGEEGYVLSCEVKGNTFKNYAKMTNTDNKHFKKFTQNANWSLYDVPYMELDRTKKYFIRAEVIKNTLTNAFMLTSGSNVTPVFADYSFTVPAQTTGVFEKEFTPHASNTSILSRMQTSDGTGFGEIVLSYSITEVSVQEPVPFGLSSTQAIISNNGQQYPIYEPTIQGKTRILNAQGVEVEAGTAGAKLVSLEPNDSKLPKLGSTPSISDTIDRAKKILRLNTIEIELDGTESWKYFDITTGNNLRQMYIQPISRAAVDNRGAINCLSTHFKPTRFNDREKTYVANHVFVTGNLIAVMRNKTETVDQWKSYLAQQKANGTPVIIRYQLATPQEIQLTDEELKTYEANKKVISLGGVGEVYDTLEVKEDGSGVVTNKLMNIDFSKGIPNGIGVNPNGTDSDNFVTVRLNGIIKPVSFVGICNKFNTWNGSATYDNKHIFRYDNEIYFVIPREEIAKYGYTGNDVVDEVNNNARRNYLIQERIQVLYEVAPTTTHIPKELIPAILTHKTNILEVGSAVRSSSFKVTVPVDQIATINAELEAIKAVLNSPSNLLLSAKYVEDEFNKNNKLESEMMN